jgi:citrate synthase
MDPMADEKPYSPGLEGIIAGVSSISEVNPEKQKLAYRGFDIEDLANHSTFEEVAYKIRLRTGFRTETAASGL